MKLSKRLKVWFLGLFNKKQKQSWHRYVYIKAAEDIEAGEFVGLNKQGEVVNYAKSQLFGRAKTAAKKGQNTVIDL